MRKGFSLIEMLVVIGIIVVLMGAAIAGYSKVTKSAERAREQELVNNVATALEALYQQEGTWPKRLVSGAGSDGRLTADIAYSLAANGRTYLSLSSENGRLIGFDRFGVVTTWAMAAIKQLGQSASLGTKIGETSKTVEDHILHYALDTDGDGIVENISVGGTSIPGIRATAVVWSCGKDGVVDPYPYLNGGRGGKNDDVYSWSPGQTRDAQ